MPEKRLAPQVHEIYTGGVRNVAVDFSGLLDDGELLTGTPTVEDDSGDLSITGAQVTTVAMAIGGTSVPAGMAVAFTVDRNSAADGTYELDITVSTDAGQTLPASVTIRCV